MAHRAEGRLSVTGLIFVGTITGKPAPTLPKEPMQLTAT